MSRTIIDKETGAEYLLAVPKCDKCGEYKYRCTITAGCSVDGNPIAIKEVWACKCDFSFNNSSEDTKNSLKLGKSKEETQ